MDEQLSFCRICEVRIILNSQVCEVCKGYPLYRDERRIEYCSLVCKDMDKTHSELCDTLLQRRALQRAANLIAETWDAYLAWAFPQMLSKIYVDLDCRPATITTTVNFAKMEPMIAVGKLLSWRIPEHLVKEDDGRVRKAIYAASTSERALANCYDLLQALLPESYCFRVEEMLCEYSPKGKKYAVRSGSGVQEDGYHFLRISTLLEPCVWAVDLAGSGHGQRHRLTPYSEFSEWLHNPNDASTRPLGGSFKRAKGGEIVSRGSELWRHVPPVGKFRGDAPSQRLIDKHVHDLRRMDCEFRSIVRNIWQHGHASIKEAIHDFLYQSTPTTVLNDLPAQISASMSTWCSQMQHEGG